MSTAAPASPALKGRKALVVGVANEHSIAWGCAKAFHELGAEVALTYLNEKARRFVEPLAESIGATILAPLDVEQPGQMEALFERLQRDWRRLDIAVHSIAWAPKDDLQGGLLESSAQGFARAMDVSCHSFIRLARAAAPLMSDGGTLFAMSYYGADKVVDHYNLMGPVKAALEASCRYLAVELGPRGIRVHPISPGPLRRRNPRSRSRPSCCWRPRAPPPSCRARPRRRTRSAPSGTPTSRGRDPPRTGW